MNHEFMTEGFEVLQKVTKVQTKFNKLDTDTFINELRDCIAGHYLGFDLINTQKHGFEQNQKQSKLVFRGKIS